MEKDLFYKGNLENDARNGNHRGWVMGKFMEEGVRHNTDMEVKYWEFNKGETGHKLKISETVEFSYMVEGQAKGIIGDEEINFQAGDYIIIRPGVKNNIIKFALTNIKGITIKAPSDPMAKKELD